MLVKSQCDDSVDRCRSFLFYCKEIGRKSPRQCLTLSNGDDADRQANASEKFEQVARQEVSSSNQIGGTKAAMRPRKKRRARLEST